MQKGTLMRRMNRAFTLIELLVVVAVLAILIAVLLPALAGVRAQVQAVQAMSNARQVVVALTAFTADGGFGFNDGPGRLSGGNGNYPPSYLYGSDQTGLQFRWEDQRDNNPNPGNGYIHWSQLLFDGERVSTDAFTSPAVTDGGAPRTNPGDNLENWSTGQRNDLNQAAPGGEFPEDRQAARVALAGNGAIFSRNKFAASGGRDPRSLPSVNQYYNKLVKATDIRQPSRTVLVTEFADFNDWESLMADGFKVKSHRPIEPFVGNRQIGLPADPYAVTPRTGTGFQLFSYPDPEPAANQVRAWSDLAGAGSLIEPGGNSAIINAVGRHHPGEQTNFVNVDGSGFRGDLRDTVFERRWGEEMYSFDDFGDPNATQVAEFPDR